LTMKFILLFLSFAASANCKLGFDAIVEISIPAFQCLKNSSYEFYIARVFRSTGTLDNTGIGNIQNANLAGLETDAYLFPCFADGCGNGTDQVTKAVSALRTAGAYYVGTLWLDIEKFKWSDDIQANRVFIQQMIDTARTLKVKVGIYTERIWWSMIVGDWKGGWELPLWWAHYDKQAAIGNFHPFGGWTSPTLHQFSGDVEGPCGVKEIDQNFMI
ncbi:hypothetical protein PFISCL1PPCAC_1456, partial [Pristionchus fissidentatus]